MPTTMSAKKRVRQNIKHQQRNRAVKSAVRTQAKAFRAAIEANDIEKARDECRKCTSAYDHAVSKGTLKKNTVARYKSRMAAALKRLAPAENSEA